jgi:hypothetical protein
MLRFDDENRFFLKKLILSEGISVAEAVLLLSPLAHGRPKSCDV